MKNPARKEMYMAAMTPGRRQKCKDAWGVLGAYEDQAGKDFSEMNRDEVQKFFAERSARRHGRLIEYKYELQKYAKWCTGMGTPYKNNPDDIDAEDSTHVDQLWFSSPEHLKECMDEVMRDFSMSKFPFVYKAFFWMIYIGVPKNEATNVTIEEVSADCSTIFHKRMVYHIPEIAREEFRLCVTCDKVDAGRINLCERRQTGKVLRTERSDSLNKLTARKISSMAAQKIGHSFEVDQVRLSGLFYSRYLEERSDAPYDLALIAEDEAKAKGKTFADSEAHTNYIIWFTKQFEIDYKRWKRAFGYDVSPVVDVDTGGVL